jgi:phosphatidate cytidylyltransferase
MALVIAAVLLLPTRWFALVTSPFLLLGAWEWTRLAGIRGAFARAAYVLLVAFAALGTFAGGVALEVAAAATVCWLAAPAWLMIHARDPRPAPPLLRGAAGLVVLVPAWGALVALHGGAGGRVVLYLLVLVWIADTAAFFAGRRFGRRPLAPAISPGKSQEGVAAAAVCGALAAFACAAFSGIRGNQMLIFVSVSLLTVLISVVGDLVESAMKRGAGVKDSGTLLPGHGGVLDRIDSVTAAAPLFATGMLLSGRVP